VNPTTDSTLTDPQRIIAELRRANAELQQRLDEAQAREVATAEVLQIINSSPGDLGPVFDAMLEKALRLCEATHGQVWSLNGGEMHAMAVHGDPKFSEWIRRQGPIRPIPGSAADRIVQGERFVHLTDRREEDAYPTIRYFANWSTRAACVRPCPCCCTETTNCSA
jgi:two-component system NtrC family sensor kinase